MQLVLADPDIAQPLFMSWDARGRMWLAEYRQYPDPAGLKMVSRDVFLRSVYDKVPLAPPHHVKGQDRISIHEDTDGDGVYDSHKIFVDGLNLATSCAIGRGGVFVTNPPYLLFYSDANQDDVPDGDPEVLLEGFGIEDSHSVINSLRFGPDGWLYGAQGSTVSANVRKPGAKEPLIRTVGQLIWRYHPERKEFEVFAEGGGNTFGCELDAHGEVFSGHNGGDTRGFHYVQGGYYRKGFGKHGPLSNPYAFGFFENIKHHNVARFTHNFIVYEEQGLPERYRGKLFGIEPLQGQVVLSDLKPMLSSFESKDIERVVTSSDPWFRPVDIKAGPNGAIYIADMYEQRIDHSSHYAGRVDRSNGRVYALRPKDTTRSKPFDYARLPSEEQIQLLNHPSKWHRQTAVRLIGDHPKDFPSKASILRQIQANREHSLDALWALNAIEGMPADDALPFLEHSNPWVRAWTIRMVVDASDRTPAFVRKLEDLSKHDGSVIVRKQLACSAKRLSPQDALPILSQLVQHDGDAEDLHQPLLVWWAIERHLGEADVSTWIQGILGNADGWHRPMVARHLLSRWMKRYASTGKREDLARASRLLSAAPDRISSDLLLQGFEEAYQGRSLASIPIELTQAIASSGGGSLALRMRQGDPQAVQEGLALVVHPKEKKGLKKQLMEVMGQVAKAEFLHTLLQVVSNEKDMELVSASLGALHAYGSDEVARTVLHRYPSMSSEAKLSAEALLALRLSTSRLLVSAVEAKQIEKTDLAQSTLRAMLLHQDKDLAKQIEIVWGPIQGASSSQMLEEIKRVTQVLQEGTGNPKQGKLLFAQHCGRCHRLFEEGGGIGPDLSPFARDNVERMLVNIINPSLEIREGFENHVLTTIDGKVLTGFVADRDQQVVVLRGVDGQNTVVPKEEIEVLKAIPQSVMPEGTLNPLADQPLRDLFAYLRANQPVN